MYLNMSTAGRNPEPNHPPHGEGGAAAGPRVHGILQGWLLLFIAEGENWGYQLVRQLTEELPADMVPDRAVIYRLLRALEREGAVTSTLQSGSGGPARKIYSLTDEGRARLGAWYRTAESRIDVLRRFLDRISQIGGASG
jgi:DNA-binding PadR family transcriptional regulator